MVAFVPLNLIRGNKMAENERQSQSVLELQKRLESLVEETREVRKALKLAKALERADEARIRRPHANA